MGSILFLLAKLADALDRLGLFREADLVDKLTSPQVATMPLFLAQLGYSLHPEGKGLRLHGRLLSAGFPADQLARFLQEAKAREDALKNLKGFRIEAHPNEVVIFSTALHVSISGGRVSAIASHDPETKALAALINNQEPTVDLLRLLAQETVPEKPPTATAKERSEWSQALENDGKKEIPSYADIPTMQADMLPYLRHYLSDEKVVDGAKAQETHDRPGPTLLRTFDRIPWQFLEKIRELDIWVHSIKHTESKPLSELINELMSIQGEVAVSKVEDNWYHPRKDTFAFMLFGIPKYKFEKDVGSAWDRWTGRKYLDNDKKWPSRIEAWMVPTRSRLVGIATDIASYQEQAAEMGITADSVPRLFTRPEQFSTSPKVKIPKTLDARSSSWPQEPLRGVLYWLRPLTPIKGRRGFVTLKLLSWLERNGATFPGYDFGHKGAGFMVLFPHGVELPPYDKEFKKFELKRYNLPELWVTTVPTKGASELRFAVIQAGEPCHIDRKGQVLTTEKGLDIIVATLQLPLSKRSPA